MARRDLIVIGASAGGVEALCEVVGGLPGDLPAAVLVVLHLRAAGPSALADVLDRSGRSPAAPATGEQPLRAGTITVAPPDRHLLVAATGTVLGGGPTEGGHRPAVDALFRSAARRHGRAVIGVQLSGALDDGAAGMVAIARAGGTTVVQDPADALHAGMPRAVLDLLAADHVRPAREIGPLLTELAGEIAGIPGADRVLPTMDERVERALWTAYRLLAQRASLAERLEAAVSAGDVAPLHRRHADITQETGAAAAALRGLLLGDLPPVRRRER